MPIDSITLNRESNSFLLFFFMVAVEQTSPTQAKNRPASQTGDFVTVIEVNGLKAAENASKKVQDSSPSSDGSPVDPVAAAKKKVPPK